MDFLGSRTWSGARPGSPRPTGASCRIAEGRQKEMERGREREAWGGEKDVRVKGMQGGQFRGCPKGRPISMGRGPLFSPYVCAGLGCGRLLCPATHSQLFMAHTAPCRSHPTHIVEGLREVDAGADRPRAQKGRQHLSHQSDTIEVGRLPSLSKRRARGREEFEGQGGWSSGWVDGKPPVIHLHTWRECCLAYVLLRDEETEVPGGSDLDRGLSPSHTAACEGRQPLGSDSPLPPPLMGYRYLTPGLSEVGSGPSPNPRLFHLFLVLSAHSSFNHTSICLTPLLIHHVTSFPSIGHKRGGSRAPSRFLAHVQSCCSWRLAGKDACRPRVCIIMRGDLRPPLTKPLHLSLAHPRSQPGDEKTSWRSWDRLSPYSSRRVAR